jgi:hypothetical protein
VGFLCVEFSSYDDHDLKFVPVDYFFSFQFQLLFSQGHIPHLLDSSMAGSYFRGQLGALFPFVDVSGVLALPVSVINIFLLSRFCIWDGGSSFFYSTLWGVGRVSFCINSASLRQGRGFLLLTNEVEAHIQGAASGTFDAPSRAEDPMHLPARWMR